MENTRTPTKLICFDLDDTLIDDNWKFETMFCDCLKAILLGLAAKAPQIDDILLLARETSERLLDELPVHKKFTPSRYAEAWQTTYRVISERQEIPVKPHIMNMLESYVMQAYEPPHLVVAGAVDALVRIRAIPNVQMHVLSVGDTEIQLSKINYSRLNYYFDHVEIVQIGESKGEYLKNMAEKYGKENVIMVGNSMSSDINPALRAGVHAIYIPRGSWNRFKSEPLHGGYAEVRRIFELPEALSELLHRKPGTVDASPDAVIA